MTITDSDHKIISITTPGISQTFSSAETESGILVQTLSPVRKVRDLTVDYLSRLMLHNLGKMIAPRR